MNDIYTTVIGNVASDVRFTTTDGGVAVASFRVASTPRRYGSNGWVDGHTSFVTVKCWRGLADNTHGSVSKGQPVLVHGRMTVRPWERDGRTGTSVDIDADAIGHDLRWGTTAFTKTARTSPEREGTESAAAELASSFDTDDGASEDGGSEDSPSAGPAVAHSTSGGTGPGTGGIGATGRDGWSVPGAGGSSAAA